MRWAADQTHLADRRKSAARYDEAPPEWRAAVHRDAGIHHDDFGRYSLALLPCYPSVDVDEIVSPLLDTFPFRSRQADLLPHD